MDWFLYEIDFRHERVKQINQSYDFLISGGIGVN